MTTRRLICLGLVFLLTTTTDASSPNTSSPFTILIDGGSTSSRLHVYEFITSNNNNNGTITTIERRGSKRTDLPLSAFWKEEIPLNETELAEHIMDCFDFAAQVVPQEYHATTRVSYQATAGMRLLTQTQQEAVYTALRNGLMASPRFVFSRLEIATLSGELEGFYGALSANYLKGTMNANLEFVQTEEDEQYKMPIGALDMGGSSTQIVFLAGNTTEDDESQSCGASNSDTDTCHEATQDELPSRLDGSDFFATSYLSYGVDQFRERLFRTWIQERQAQLLDEQCDTKRLDNPCTFQGYAQEFEGYNIVGTGNAHECVKQVQRLIPHADECDRHDQLGSHVGGIQHPPVRGKFFAMSLYFFVLDSLRELSSPNKEAYEALNLHWPNPSIQELYNALDGLCSRSWRGDLETIQHTAHAYTRAEILPQRCLESVYLVTLLKDGFGFHPESRDITFTFLVDGSEVEWTLGMALAMRAEEEGMDEVEPDENTHDSVNDQADDEQPVRKSLTKQKEDAPTSDK